MASLKPHMHCINWSFDDSETREKLGRPIPDIFLVSFAKVIRYGVGFQEKVGIGSKLVSMQDIVRGQIEPLL